MSAAISPAPIFQIMMRLDRIMIASLLSMIFSENRSPLFRIMLRTHHLGERYRLFRCPCPRRRNRCARALDESAAEHARLSRRRIVEHAGLAGRNALLAGNEFDLV